jgi:hypothetical protein
MVLWAMAAAAAADRAEDAAEYIALSRAASARMPHDRHDYEVNFGPTQVAMQTTHAYAVLRQPDRALAAAAGVRQEDLFAISYGRHLLDVALAQADLRQDSAAVRTLQAAKDLAPVWFRHQVVSRELVAGIRDRSPRQSAALRDLVQALSAR